VSGTAGDFTNDMSPSTDLREHREFASELKFVVPRPLAEQIRDWTRARLSPDPNGAGNLSDAYRITSLYFDTEQFDVFHRKGSFGRSKYRIRRYGSSEVAFLERKLKTRGLVSKRRTIVRLDELERVSGLVPERRWVGCWYHQRLLARQLRPICQISYERTARVSMTRCGPIRLTLDNAIHARPVGGVAFATPEEGILLVEHDVIIELKYRLEMPALFKQLVEEFRLNPKPISKYRLAAVALGLVAEKNANPSTPPNGESSLCLIS
jgi:hypothetical protein